MSVYSYIEVLEPRKASQDDERLVLEFGHGIGWFYQIGVAGGKRTYKGAEYSGDLDKHQLEGARAFSFYELPLTKALQNYQTAISACLQAVELDLPELMEWLHGELKLLFEAQDWYQRAWLKLPEGTVELDWCEAVWYLDEEVVENEDFPNHNFTSFVELARDIKAVKSGKLSRKKFSKRYQQNRKSTDVVRPEDIPWKS